MMIVLSVTCLCCPTLSHTQMYLSKEHFRVDPTTLANGFSVGPGQYDTPSADVLSPKRKGARAVFGKMHRENCKPNVVTYNSLIAACAHGGHWEKASEFFEQMQTQGEACLAVRSCVCIRYTSPQ